ncbi:MAG: cobalamin biosynthesis protein CbiA [Desulfobacteraceae bacterium]|nr:cobalamin biosynthesis protein CbiA [Desulfobacteraceae bacterium]
MCGPVDKECGIDLPGLTVIVGNYGSGKTEVAVNLAVYQNAIGRRVRIADLDLVNPYFRTREARKVLNQLGIETILPPEGLLQADLPILSPAISGLIRQPGDCAIIDVGGDDAGATVLAALADAFSGRKKPFNVLQVVNPYRPNTDSVEGCIAIRKAIEAVSKLSINGWVGNANLIDETQTGHIRYGYQFMRALSERSGLPVAFITVAKELLSGVDIHEFEIPLLTIYRQLVPPWKKAIALS